MNMFRLLLGYAIGFSLFAVVIPYLLVVGASNPDTWLGGTLFSSNWLRWFVSIPVFLIGVLFAVWSNVFLLEKGKGGPLDLFRLSISPRSTSLVTTGPYRLCRHPMVFGTICLYTGIALFLNSIHDLVLVWACIPLFLIFLKQSEEKRLIRDFGQAYIDYRNRVPMLVPFLKRHQSK
jgi:protein-S-isoprenylcysteine O-methyltransferase Ste14